VGRKEFKFLVFFRINYIYLHSLHPALLFSI
jgi:hypothetical protein